MKRTNKIISLMLSVQMAATSVFAGPVFLQKQPNPIGGVTAPLDNKDKKNIGAKTIAKKTVLFPLKALWWTAKPQLIMLGTGIFDLSLLGGYGGYKAYKWCEENPILAELAMNYDPFDGTLIRTPLSEEKAKTLCADMYCCLKRMGANQVLTSSESFSEYDNIAKKYSSLTDKFEIMEEFLSHFELINNYLNDITERLMNLSDTPVYVYNKEYCIFAFDKSFKIGDQTIEQIIKKFYKQCSVIVHPDMPKNAGKKEQATETFQKLNDWKETIYTILEI